MRTPFNEIKEPAYLRTGFYEIIKSLIKKEPISYDESEYLYDRISEDFPNEITFYEFEEFIKRNQ